MEITYHEALVEDLPFLRLGPPQGTCATCCTPSRSNPVQPWIYIYMYIYLHVYIHGSSLNLIPSMPPRSGSLYMYRFSYACCLLTGMHVSLLCASWGWGMNLCPVLKGWDLSWSLRNCVRPAWTMYPLVMTNSWPWEMAHRNRWFTGLPIENHRNRWFTELKNGWIFPWQTVK